MHVVYSQFQNKTESVFLRKPIATSVCVCGGGGGGVSAHVAHSQVR